MTNLPFAPEASDLLKERFPQALTRSYSPVYAIKEGIVPGRRREHIFDFVDGYRLQITMDDFTGMPGSRLGKMIHVSGMRWYNEHGQEIFRSPMGLPEPEQEKMKKDVLEHFRLLSDVDSEPDLNMLTPISVQFFFKVN